MKDKKVWIVGASAGIGRALAENLDKKGANLILSARNIQDLNVLNQSLSKNHQVVPLDISSDAELISAVEQIFKEDTHVDYIIFMAAIYKTKDIPQYSYQFAKDLLEVNLLGAINLTYKVIPKLIKTNKPCQLLFTASVAGYVGLPKGQPYSCSKAGLINFAESLHAELATTNIKVRVINPGFVKTRLTDKNDFTMPCIISGERAAECIVKDLEKNNFEITFPKRFTRTLKVLRMFPYKIILKVTSMIMARRA